MKKLKYLPIIIVFIYFLVGIGIYKDYGFSHDEQAERNKGKIYLKYVFQKINLTQTHFYQKNLQELTNLHEFHDRYQGPVINIFLACVEYIFKIQDTEYIFQVRHLFTFLLYFLGCLALYGLLKLKYPGQIGVQCIGLLFYILTPRFFAEGFYNSKDVILYSFMMISIYFTYRYLKFNKNSDLVWLALSTAICIDIRIIGITLVPLTFALIGFSNGIKNVKKLTAQLSVYLFTLIALVLLFWPLMWERPLIYFYEAFQTMRQIFWGGKVLYLGNYYQIPSDQFPWHYVFVWIGVTMPIVVFSLGIFKLLHFFGTLFKLKTWNYDHSFDSFLIILFALPIFSVIFLNAIIYDSWRHLYYVYAPLLVLGIGGFDTIQSLVSTNIRLKQLVFGAVLANCLLLFVNIVQMHPYQNVYFNVLAGKNIRHTFEMDYWRLSYAKALNYIAKTDTSKQIRVFINGNKDVLLISPKWVREKISIDPDTLLESKYFVTNYRYHHEDYPYKNEIFAVYAGDLKITSVFKLY
ncbi:MAG: glycosyltransferase family 39 protein [Cytophagales bacterium]